MHDSASTDLALHISIDKLSICEANEPVAEAAAAGATSESRLLAPFSQLRHLNLAQNKVCCSVDCLTLLLLSTVVSIYIVVTRSVVIKGVFCPFHVGCCKLLTVNVALC